LPGTASRKVRGGVKRESPENRRARAGKILGVLRKEFPNALTALTHENPFQLLIATILSAQCTDERVNKVTPALFRARPSPAYFAETSQSELENEIRSTGFYRMKAKNILACCAGLIERHGGNVPASMEALVLLPGVGRKTANVVLGQAYGIASGIVVDTHVHRLAQRMGLTGADQAERIEQDLMVLFPEKDWIDVGSILILHGRRTCKARKPDCPSCPVRTLCPSAELFGTKQKHASS
jgi:endonuclease III